MTLAGLLANSVTAPFDAGGTMAALALILPSPELSRHGPAGAARPATRREAERSRGTDREVERVRQGAGGYAANTGEMIEIAAGRGG